VLVTGADGFIGASAVAALRRRGFDVQPLGRQQADVLDVAAADAFVRRAAATHLLHLAWCTEPGRFWDDPANDLWVDASVALARAFRDAGGQRTVVAGTCAQYDWSTHALGTDGVAHEHSTPRRPATRYGRAKEALVAALGEDAAAFGLIFLPYGPHEDPARLVPSVTRALLAGQPAEITSGVHERDFIHVDDVGAAFAALVDSDVTGLVNVGTGVGTSVADVARTIARIAGREDLLRIGTLPDRPGEPPRLVADVARLRDEVGYTPELGLEAGLRATVDWWRERAR
jgi:nucleoside-diphosphate-sugar epimerase